MGTHDRMPFVPNQPKYGKRGARFTDDEWARALWVAERRGVNRSDVLRSGLEHEYRVEMRRYRAEQRAAEKGESTP